MLRYIMNATCSIKNKNKKIILNKPELFEISFLKFLDILIIILVI
jgi:hypothetical protein